MYTKETIKKIAEVLKLDASIFEANFKSDKEEVLEVPVLFTEDEKTTFGTNRFNEGKKAMSEIAVKDLKEKHGLEFTGKSLDSALEAYADKKLIDAKIAPDAKVKTLQDENKTLKGSLETALGKEQTLTKDYNDKLFQVETKSNILTHIPNETIIPREDLVDLFMNRHRVSREDDSIIIYKGDQKLVDNVLNPIPLKDAVAQFSESYLKKEGMGGKDLGGGTPGKFKSISQFEAHCVKNNIAPMSDEGQKLLSENKEATFDYNS